MNAANDDLSQLYTRSEAALLTATVINWMGAALWARKTPYVTICRVNTFETLTSYLIVSRELISLDCQYTYVHMYNVH